MVDREDVLLEVSLDVVGRALDLNLGQAILLEHAPPGYINGN
jgi:hypothetical protein